MRSRILAAVLATLGMLATHAQAGIVGHTDAASAPVTAANAASAPPIELNPDSSDPALSVDDQAGTHALNEAARLIQSGRPQEAIEAHLDPLIARLDARYRDAKGQLFCANTMTEVLLYLTQASVARREATVTDGNLCNAYFLRGFAEIDLRKGKAALADYERALALSPNNPHYLSEMGELHSNMRDWNGALGYFRRARDAAEAYSMGGKAKAEAGRALRGIGFVDVELGKLDEAEQMYRKCLEIDPGDEKARGELGYVQGQRAKQIDLGK